MRNIFIMLNNVRTKGPLIFSSDVGQYNVLKKHLQLWYNSARMVNGATTYKMPDFDLPEVVEKLELIDTAGDLRMVLPLDVFLATKLEDGGYELPIEEWKAKYKPVRF